MFDRKVTTFVIVVLAAAMLYTTFIDDTPTTSGKVVSFVKLGNASHKECKGPWCIDVAGEGNDSCYTNADCFFIQKMNKTQGIVNPKPRCWDTDGGKNYFKRGTVYWNDPNNGTMNVTDLCIGFNSTFLREGYCWKGHGRNQQVDCTRVNGTNLSTTCLQGKCV